MADPLNDPDLAEQLVEHLAEAQWRRMTRSTTAYADLPEQDKRACRALVQPVLEDIRAWVRCPLEGCIAVRGHEGRHPISTSTGSRP